MNKLEEALAYLGIKNLPKEGKPEFEGLAIVLVKKTNSMSYVIARWNDTLKRHEVIKDFDSRGGNVVSFEYFYPIKEKKVEEKDFYDLSLPQMKKYLDDKNIPYLSKNKEGYVRAYEAYKSENK